MSIWVSVYCQTHIGRINPPDLTAGIKDRLDYFSDPFAQEKFWTWTQRKAE